MTRSDLRPGAGAARPESDKQRQAAAIREPADRPEFAVEIWPSSQLREQRPDRALPLAEALEAASERPARRVPEPDREPEAGPWRPPAAWARRRPSAGRWHRSCLLAAIGRHLTPQGSANRRGDRRDRARARESPA